MSLFTDIDEFLKRTRASDAATDKLVFEEVAKYRQTPALTHGETVLTSTPFQEQARPAPPPVDEEITYQFDVFLDYEYDNGGVLLVEAFVTLYPPRSPTTPDFNPTFLWSEVSGKSFSFDPTGNIIAIYGADQEANFGAVTFQCVVSVPGIASTAGTPSVTRRITINIPY